MTIRTFQSGDSIEEITLLLNRAYSALADRGLRYVASWQTPDMTTELISMGTCLLALDGEEIVGTVMLYPQQEDSECAYYGRAGVFHFGKFGVDPARQGEGIGRLLYEAVEREAIAQGAVELACDTADSADHLIDIYLRWGFAEVARQDWSITNYKSIVFAKALTPL